MVILICIDARKYSREAKNKFCVLLSVIFDTLNFLSFGAFLRTDSKEHKAQNYTFNCSRKKKL